MNNKCFPILSCLAFLLTACTNDAGILERQQIRVVSYFEDGYTKVGYTQSESALVPQWEAGDRVSLFFDGQTHHYVATDSGLQTEFVPATPADELNGIPENTVIYGVYPDLEITNNAVVVTNGPSGFIFEEKDRIVFAYNYMRGAGVVKDGVINIGFRHIFSYLKVIIPEEFLSVAGVSGICLDFSDPYLILSYAQYNLSSLSFSEMAGVNAQTNWHFLYTQDGEFYNKGFLYFPITPGVYKNLEIEVRPDGYPPYHYQTELVEFVPNKIYVLDPVRSIIYEEQGDVSDMTIVKW